MNWKYKVYCLNGMAFDEAKALNKLGEQGWELVGINSGRAYLKARLEPEVQYTAPSIEELMEKTDKIMIALGGVKQP